MQILICTNSWEETIYIYKWFLVWLLIVFYFLEFTVNEVWVVTHTRDSALKRFPKFAGHKNSILQDLLLSFSS